MLLFLSILIAFLSLSIFIAGLLAVIRNPRVSENRWFLTMVVFLGLWIPCNFIDSNIVSATWTHVFLRLDLALAPFIGWALLRFVEAFHVEAIPDKNSRKFTILSHSMALGFNIILALLSLNGQVANVIINHEKATVAYTTIFAVYATVIVGYFIIAFIKLFRKRKKANGAEKGALNFIFAGLLFAVVANIMTNLVFPLVFSHRSTIQGLNLFGYAGLMILVLAIYLAITTQKLFDIRLIVARSVAYVMSLSTLGGGFLGISFVATSYLFPTDMSNSATRWLYGSLSILLSLLFPHLRRFFDRVTSSIFFRDAYDSQTYLDKFNKVLVSNYSIVPILRKSASTIYVNLKPTYCVFLIHETRTVSRRVIGTKGNPQFSEQDVAFLRSVIPRMKQKFIITDELESSDAHLKIILRKNRIAVISKLASSNDAQGVGYLVLGSKKSGNPYSSQDIKMIEISSNGLAIAIQNALHNEEIENFNITLQAKVDEATRRLRRTNEKLKALDETKDDFISMASHQLRTPLTSVKGYLSLVLEGDAGKLTPLQNQMLGQAFMSSQRMVYLIADLLNVSRLKTGKFIIESKPVNLASLINEELSQLTESVKSHQLTLEYDAPKDFPEALLDETKIRQVVMNFADNAIYYTQAGGHVKIELIDKPSTIEFRVIDNGLGVPKDEQPHLFTKFYRAANARKARPDGTGLGLFMAKKVIAAQGGVLIFESVEGKGSTFGFIFNKQQLASQAQIAVVK